MDNSDDMDWAPDARRNRYTLIYAWVNGVEYPGPVAVLKTEPYPLSISNYPNPFNPSTTISITLPKSSAVTLSIYDIQGRKVRTLAVGQFPAGNHTVLWDGADDSGSRVSSGVYFSRMDCGGNITVRKMLMIK